MNERKSQQFLVALLTILWASMIIAIFFGWTPGTSKWQKAKTTTVDLSGSNRLEIVQNCERHWFSGTTSETFDSVVWKTNGGNGWAAKQFFRGEHFELSGGFPFPGLSQGPMEIHSFDAAHRRAILKLGQLKTNGMIMSYAWYDWDLRSGTGTVLQVCKQPFDPYIPPVTPLTLNSSTAISNTVKLNLPPTINQSGYTTVTTSTTKTILRPRLFP